MIRELGRFDLHQIRLHIFDHPAPDRPGQQFADAAMDRGGCGKGPTLDSFAPDNFGDLLRELLADPAIGLGLHRRALSDRIGMTAIAVANRKTSGLVGQLLIITPVGVGDIKGLHQLQARSTIRCVIDPIGLNFTTVRNDDE